MLNSNVICNVINAEMVNKVPKSRYKYIFIVLTYVRDDIRVVIRP